MFRDVTPKMEEILLEFGDYTDPMWGKLICFQGNEQIFFGDLAVSIKNCNSISSNFLKKNNYIE